VVLKAIMMIFIRESFWTNPDYSCKLQIACVQQCHICILVILVCFSVTPRDAGERGHSFPCSLKREATGSELTFHHSIVGKFMVNKI